MSAFVSTFNVNVKLVARLYWGPLNRAISVVILLYMNGNDFKTDGVPIFANVYHLLNVLGWTSHLHIRPLTAKTGNRGKPL